MRLRLRSDEARRFVLRGERVVLRPPVMRDWRQWAAVRAESRQFLEPWEPSWPMDALGRAAFRRRVRQCALDQRQGTAYVFHIFRRRDERLIGGISLANVRRGVAQAGSVGYWVGAAYARQGYMTEALGAVVDFAFETLGLHRVEAACLPHNEASRALLRRLGFREEGLAREYLRIAGRWQDHVVYGLLAADRRQARAPAATARESEAAQ